MRTSEVTYDAVATQCQRIFAAGEKVTFQRVFLGLNNRGSSRIVTEYIQKWRAQTGDMLAVRVERSLPGVPELLVQRLDGIVLETWQLALDQAEGAYQTARTELDKERGEWQERLDAAAETVVELATARATLAAREQEIAALYATNQEGMRQLHALEKQLADLRDDHTTLTERLAAEQRAHQESIGRMQLQADERLAAQAINHAAALEATHQIEASQRTQWAQITDDLRQQMKATEAQLQGKLVAMSADFAALQQRVSTALMDAATWQGRAESAEMLLTRMTTRKKKPPVPPFDKD